VSGCKLKRERSAAKVGEDRTMKDKAVAIASEKAKELGYSLEKMKLKVTRVGTLFMVYFGPKEMVLGGDLTIKIDSTTWQIVEIQRGQ